MILFWTPWFRPVWGTWSGSHMNIFVAIPGISYAKLEFGGVYQSVVIKSLGPCAIFWFLRRVCHLQSGNVAAICALFSGTDRFTNIAFACPTQPHQSRPTSCCKKNTSMWWWIRPVVTVFFDLNLPFEVDYLVLIAHPSTNYTMLQSLRYILQFYKMEWVLGISASL